MDGRQGTPLARVGPAPQSFLLLPWSLRFFSLLFGPCSLLCGRALWLLWAVTDTRRLGRSECRVSEQKRTDHGKARVGSCGLVWMGDVWANQLYPILGKSDPPHLTLRTLSSSSFSSPLLLAISLIHLLNPLIAEHPQSVVPGRVLFNIQPPSFFLVLYCLALGSNIFFYIIIGTPVHREFPPRLAQRKGNRSTGETAHAHTTTLALAHYSTTDFTLPTDIDRLESFVFFPRLIFINLPVAT